MALYKSMRKRSSQNFRSTSRFEKKDTYVPPPEDVETWGISKMLQCWENRNKPCFWENFMWIIDNKQDTQNLILNFDTPWQPDLQGDNGSDTRCITSDQPKVKWWSTIGETSIPNPFNQEYKDVRCADILSAGYQLKMEQSCKDKCNRLAQGEHCAGRDANNMGFEQVGCDGKTVYCWCNSENEFKK